MEELRRRHAEYFLSLAEENYHSLIGAGRGPWLDLWGGEWGNVRATLQWSLETRHPEIGLLLVGMLWVWCWLDGPVELRDWVERLLAMPEAQEPTRARGWGLGLAAVLAWNVGDMERAPALSDLAVEVARSAGDERLMAGVLPMAAAISDSARPVVEEARARFRRLNDPFGVGFSTVAGVRSMLAEGEVATLHAWLNESLDDFRRTGDVFGQGLVLRTLGTLAVGARQFEIGRAYLMEALEQFRTMREKRYVPLILLTLGGISRSLGEDRRALDEFREALVFVYRYTGRGNLASCVEGLAGVALDGEHRELAARLLGAAHRLRDSSHSVSFPMGEVLNVGVEERLRASMEPDAFMRHFTDGYALREEQIVQTALDYASGNTTLPWG
jgi:hypothetical protein